MGDLNYLDILALLILLVSVVTAVAKGLILELLSIASVVVGLILAVMFYRDVAGMLGVLGLSVDLATEFLGFVVIFVGVLLAGSVVSVGVNKLLKSLHLKWIDRCLGGVFGFVRGYLINAVVFLALTAFQIKHDLLVDSKLAEFFLAGARILVIFIPEDLKVQFSEAYDWLAVAWQESIYDR
jgi:membrane protein required for colicin V production